MNSFSINRFGKTLRWVLCTNFRSLLMWTIGAALVVFMCEMIYWKYAITHHNSPFTMLENFGEVGTVLFVIASMVLISSVVVSINDKRKRESFMMLPSTNAEKYLSLIVYSTVVCILCVFLAMVLGDTLRMAFLWGRDLMGFPVSHQGESYSVYVGNHWWCGMYADCWVRWFDSALPMLIYNLLPEVRLASWYEIVNWVFYIICMVWIHSLYTLSGTLMRKYAFVAASLVFIILFVSFAKFVRYYDLVLFRSDWTEAGVYCNSQIGTVIYVLCAVLPLFSIANYWISFRIFKGFELITNKWFNYDFHK